MCSKIEHELKQKRTNITRRSIHQNEHCRSSALFLYNELLWSQ